MKKRKPMKNKAKLTKWNRLGLIFVLIFVMISGYGLVKLYTGIKTTPAVITSPDDPEVSGDLKPVEPVTEPIQLYQVKLEEIQNQIALTEANLQNALQNLNLNVTSPVVEDMEVEILDGMKVTWERKGGSVTIASAAQTLGDVTEALKTAVEEAGSTLLRSEPVQKAETQSETLYFGFIQDDTEVVTHQYTLAFAPPVPPAKKPQAKAKLAFVIDDLGYQKAEFEQMMTIPRPMTFAVIPHLPRSVQQAKRVWQEGYDLILHQPMEPASAHNPGEGAIYTRMSEEEIIATLSRNLATLPQGIIGANNHMGSKATADERVMEVVLKFFLERGMFFIDSSTAPDSVVATVATRVGERYAENRIFLDNVDQLDKIKEQIIKAGKLALREGEAIAIGHVRNYTAQAILESIDELEAMGVKIVSAKELLKYPGLR